MGDEPKTSAPKPEEPEGNANAAVPTEHAGAAATTRHKPRLKDKMRFRLSRGR